MPKSFHTTNYCQKKIEWLLFPKECFFSKRACERFWSFLIFDPNRTGSFKSDSKLFNKCKIWQYFKIDHIPFCFMLIKSIVKKIICESMLVKMLQSQNFCFILKHFSNNPYFCMFQISYSNTGFQNNDSQTRKKIIFVRELEFGFGIVRKFGQFC